MTIGYEYRPGSLYLNVTNRCSSDCTFCVRQAPGFSLRGYDMRLEREPTADEVLASISLQEAQRGRPFDEIVFCGFGEPTYRLEPIGVVGRTLREQGRRVRLNTNGQSTLINGRGPLLDLEGALDEASISLNAPDARIHAALCRPIFGETAYPAVIELIRSCIGRFETLTATVVGSALEPEDPHYYSRKPLRPARIFEFGCGLPAALGRCERGRYALTPAGLCRCLPGRAGGELTCCNAVMDELKAMHRLDPEWRWTVKEFAKPAHRQPARPQSTELPQNSGHSGRSGRS